MISRVYRSYSKILTIENPYTYDLVQEIEYISPVDALNKLQNAHKFQAVWKFTPLEERIRLFSSAIDLLSNENNARDITLQMGKPIVQARQEIEMMKVHTNSMIQLARNHLDKHVIEDVPGRLRAIQREPKGVILQIASWQYPFLSVINTLASSVLSGNTVLLKHSSYSPLCGEHFAAAFAEVGIPEVVQSCFLDQRDVSEFIRCPQIGHVHFAGSTASGRQLYQQVAESRFIDIGLQMSGKDSAYVAEDVNVNTVAKQIIRGCLYNAGQSASSIERVYVQEQIFDDFMNKVVAIAREYKIGDPLLDTTTLGPLALPDTPIVLKERVMSAIDSGAQVVLGGQHTQDADDKGRFFNPTVIIGVDEINDLFASESFGPIVAISKIKSDDEAITRMNTNKFGISNSIYTQSRQRAMVIAQQLESSTIYMNKSDEIDPLLPRAGRKESGQGVSGSSMGFDAVTRPKVINFVG